MYWSTKFKFKILHQKKKKNSENIITRFIESKTQLIMLTNLIYTNRILFEIINI